jgi:DNA-binding protein YbaB
MDGREWLAGHRDVQTALPSLPPDGRYPGEDGSGQVRVEVDGAAREVAVVLADGWRSTIGPDGLAAAVLQAFSAATTARLTAWATAPATAGSSPPSPGEPEQPPVQPPRPQASRVTLDSLSRAWRDLREFRLRLTALHAATETVSSPGRLAVVTVAGGQLVSLDLDPDWLRTATSRDLERHIRLALRAALATIAALPERALEGCPDLQALLSGIPFPLFGSPHSAR